MRYQFYPSFKSGMSLEDAFADTGCLEAHLSSVEQGCSPECVLFRVAEDSCNLLHMPFLHLLSCFFTGCFTDTDFTSSWTVTCSNSHLKLAPRVFGHNFLSFVFFLFFIFLPITDTPIFKKSWKKNKYTSVCKFCQVQNVEHVSLVLFNF